MNDKQKLYDELTEAFICYQWRLEHPIPEPGETFVSMKGAYMNDPVFHNKVQSLASGVMRIVDKYLPEPGPEKNDE